MNTELLSRRLRGALGTAIVWALIWLPIGVLLPLLRNSRSVTCFYCPPYWFLTFLATWTGWGAFSGAVFATLLIMAGHQGGLAQLSIRRVAVRGALGALVLPVGLVVAAMIQEPGPYTDWVFTGLALTFAGLLGAGCASATLALARRAP